MQHVHFIQRQHFNLDYLMQCVLKGLLFLIPVTVLNKSNIKWCVALWMVQISLKMLQNRLRGARYPICCGADSNRDHVRRSEQMKIWGSHIFFCASALLKSAGVNWKAPFSKLVQLFMKGWLIHLLRLVKLSKIHWSAVFHQQGRLVRYHGNYSQVTFRQWQIFTIKKCL